MRLLQEKISVADIQTPHFLEYKGKGSISKMLKFGHRWKDFSALSMYVIVKNLKGSYIKHWEGKKIK